MKPWQRFALGCGMWILAGLALAESVPAVDVVASEPSVRHLAEELSTSAPAMVVRVARRLELPAPDRVMVVIAPRQPRSRQEAARLGLREVPRWAAGLAQPERGRLVIFADRIGGYAHPSLPGTLAHEIAHLVLGANLPKGAWVPRWYDEGLAQVVERDLSLYEALQLARMTVVSEPPRLSQLSAGWPEDAAGARDAYAISLSFVTFAENHAYPGAPRRLAQEMQQGALFKQAFETAYGERLGRLERLWRESLQDKYLRRPVWVLLGLSNAIMGVLAVMAVIRIRRRNRLRLEEWDNEETGSL